HPHLYVPLASSMTNLMEMNISFEKGRPFPSLLQLLSILPSQSADFLPEGLQGADGRGNSPILKYYHTEFAV
ncbi:unnamed protein product, partial [Scytosiphon promiscuus]